MKFILLIIIILTAVLRIYDIEIKNMWFDEVYSWKLSQKSVTVIVSDTSGDIHPPFFYIVLKYWTELFNDSILSMRLLSVLTSLLSIIFIYKISKIVFNKNYLVIFILLLYAVSPVNIFYSQEVRMLSLNLFLCLGSVYYFLISFKDSSFKNLLLYILFSVLAIYTHYFAFLIIFTEFIILILKVFTKTEKFSETKKLFISVFLINLFYLPWYPVFFQQVSKGQPWRTVLTFKDSGINFLDYFKHIFLSNYYTFEPGYIHFLATFITYFILAFLLYSLFRFFNSKVKLMKDNNYTILFFFIPLIIAGIISIKQNILLSRYLSIVVPFSLITIMFFSDKYLKRK
ncbi:MAG TPA: glycosyltransferase family 39 protein, partial [Ignavibacteria bacterium]|nr:glycosyltransferase family 39 protein [Ignavibacteria bacterium]